MQEEKKRREKRAFADLDFRARISFGSDDNVFRSADAPYVDFADPALPLVTPQVRSGVFMPVNLGAKYRINAYRFEGFYGAYRLSGRYYQDKELDNANEFSHELSFGSEYKRKDEERGRVRELWSAFKVAQHDEVYYDPDDGVPEYDHEYFLFGLNTQYRFTSTSLLRLTVAKASRRFGDRPSYDLDGIQRVGNPNVRYDYLDIGLEARQRITRNMWFGVEYERSDRTDHHVGYNDYIRDSYGFEFHWNIGRRFDIDLTGYYRLYDFPNAFAFHNPVAGLKTFESVDGKLKATFRMTRHLSLVLEGKTRQRASNDIRIQYDRNQYVLGIRWDQ